ncbi:putative transcriptional regulatory protein [Cercospora beticola]|uniref:Putative transcriptional regulatory protein n=1 Tax=Cercospora beticola TaxID=122368 RepID=A0A2G5I3M5_CERBT|nr:putative transcriptional regulatory protein [Cercospora beticola]PIA99415.1 putative transcriptional regulatory protein [Cercospora beticola]WPA99788.1 hypothetical protein RHO25_004408 [Cercospora beticola]CAK1362056.1 unnamed protein product [Cercospora beticola]
MGHVDSDVPVMEPPNGAKPSRKRKRPKVPEQQRQRAAVACGSCRRLKEKCNGKIPCDRCQKYHRVCEPASVTQSTTAPSQKTEGEGLEVSARRVQHLEYVARHFLGDNSLTDDALSKIVARLESENSAYTAGQPSDDPEAPALDEERFTVQNVSPNTTHYSGEFSHWSFSMRLKSYVEQQLQVANGRKTEDQFQVLDYWRAHHLKSRDSRMKTVLDSLPPKEVALFLSSVYFRFAQTNTFFADEGWIREKLDTLYQQNIVLNADDACWLCSTLSVLAVGTQFAHMPQAVSGQSENGIETVADAVGISFYQMAADLIPDVVAIASVDSVQAFLCLAHFALPMDAHGVSYTYLGLALRMAIQNGMHRKYLGNEFDEHTLDLRNRLWWSTYRLEKRVSILHGRPSSISSSEIDADHPADVMQPGKPATGNRQFESSMTKITDWLGDMSFLVFMLRKSTRLRHTYFERLLHVKGQFLEWWNTAQIPDFESATTRAVLHLHLSKHMNLVFVGRPFLLNKAKTNTKTPERSGQAEVNQRWTELADDAVRSAEQIITIEQHMHGTIGLAKASWTEFSSCRAAVLVLLAQCLHESSEHVLGVLENGMHLIRYMSTANASTRSEASLMASLETAIRHLHTRRGQSASQEVTETLNNFKKWASHFQGETPEPTEGLFDPLPTHMAAAVDMYDTFGDLDWNPFDASLFDDTPIDFGELGMHHFDEAFSIADMQPPTAPP